MAVTLPLESTVITEANGTTISRVEEIIYGKKFDQWLTRTDKIEQQIKLVYSVYLGQCDEDIKASLAEHPDFKLADQEKNPIKLYKILQSVNFSYRSNQEPILTMWNAKADSLGFANNLNSIVNDS